MSTGVIVGILAAVAVAGGAVYLATRDGGPNSDAKPTKQKKSSGGGGATLEGAADVIKAAGGFVGALNAGK